MVGMNKKYKNQLARKTLDVQNSTEFIDKLLLRVLLLILVIVPLIMRVAVFQIASPSFTRTPMDTGITSNVFTYYKLIWLTIGTIAIALIFFFKMVYKKYLVAKSYINVPVAIMFLLIVLSSLFSNLHTISLLGYLSRNEGAIAYLCYLVLFYVAANICYTERGKKWIFYALIPVIAVNLLLGLVYFYGYNILNSDLIISFILPPNMPNSSLRNGSYISSTLMNPDFVSGMSAVFVVIFLTRAVLEKDFKARSLNVVIALGAFMIILTSFAKSGFFTTIALLPVLLLIIFFSKNRRQGLFTLVGALMLFSMSLGVLTQHNPMVWDKTVGFFVSTKTGGETITDLVKKSDVELDKSPDTTEEFNLPQLKWAPGTGRLYIWPKTLELIKERPILGYGRDTLPYVFNQDDPEKASGLADPYTLVDKPHNIFLDLAVGSGVPCLLAFLALCFYYVKDNIKAFRLRVYSEDSNILIVLFVGWCAFLIQGMFNDTIIGTGVFFWILFGVGVAVARQQHPLESK
jgi:hypothetical protein